MPRRNQNAKRPESGDVRERLPAHVTPIRTETFWIPRLAPNINSIIESKGTRSKRSYKSLRKLWYDEVFHAARFIKPFTHPIWFTVHCYESNQTRDPNNIVLGATKLIMDAIHKQEGWGLIPEDDWIWNAGLGVPKWEVNKSNPGVLVILDEVDNG